MIIRDWQNISRLILEPECKEHTLVVRVLFDNARYFFGKHFRSRCQLINIIKMCPRYLRFINVSKVPTLHKCAHVSLISVVLYFKKKISTIFHPKLIKTIINNRIKLLNFIIFIISSTLRIITWWYQNVSESVKWQINAWKTNKVLKKIGDPSCA